MSDEAKYSGREDGAGRQGRTCFCSEEHARGKFSWDGGVGCQDAEERDLASCAGGCDGLHQRAYELLISMSDTRSHSWVRTSAPRLNNMIHPLPIRQPQHFSLPVRRLRVINDVRCAERRREREFGRGGRCGDDGGAEGGCDLSNV